MTSTPSTRVNALKIGQTRISHHETLRVCTDPAGLSDTLPQVPTFADFSSGEARPLMESSSAQASSAGPNLSMR